VRIQTLSEGSPYFNRVTEKQDKDDFSGQFKQQQGQNFRKKQEQDEVDVTDQKVSEAIESFGADHQTAMNGLTATQEGSGPGLKIVLRDGQGAVIRQLSGEEFLRLRESVLKSEKSCGKILDQKL